MEITNVSERIKNLTSRTPDEDLNYYFFTLTGEPNGELVRSCYSEWVGFADGDKHIELRQASIIRADITAETFREMGEAVFVVHDVVEFAIFYSLGGHALLEEKFTKDLVPNWLDPVAGVATELGGFVHRTKVPNELLNRATTKKLRMKVLQRDQYGCRICGRRPADHADIDLHVHHIQPWAMGGLTKLDNLITLCDTCHLGLDPHFNSDLFNLIPRSFPKLTLELHLKNYLDGVRLYREIIKDHQN